MHSALFTAFPWGFSTFCFIRLCSILRCRVRRWAAHYVIHWRRPTPLGELCGRNEGGGWGRRKRIILVEKEYGQSWRMTMQGLFWWYCLNLAAFWWSAFKQREDGDEGDEEKATVRSVSNEAANHHDVIKTGIIHCPTKSWWGYEKMWPFLKATIREQTLNGHFPCTYTMCV